LLTFICCEVDTVNAVDTVQLTLLTLLSVNVFSAQLTLCSWHR